MIKKIRSRIANSAVTHAPECIRIRILSLFVRNNFFFKITFSFYSRTNQRLSCVVFDDMWTIAAFVVYERSFLPPVDGQSRVFFGLCSKIRFVLSPIRRRSRVILYGTSSSWQVGYQSDIHLRAVCWIHVGSAIYSSPSLFCGLEFVSLILLFNKY